MTTAMPEVKPTTTGRGIKRINRPKRQSPAASRIAPARKQARNIPESPYLPDTMPPRMTVMAPVGPEI